jgi:hypothetical protein
MRKRKRGTLKSGRSGKKVKSRKQAIAIGLSEARKKGKKVPPKRGSKSRSRRKKVGLGKGARTQACPGRSAA